jgi:putative ABC transport system permease protein
MISSALLFASTAMSGTLAKMQADMMRQYYGSAELLITTNENSTSFPTMQGVKRYKEYFEYMVGAFNGSGVYKPNVNESVWLSLMAVDYDDLQAMNPFSMSEQLESKAFSGEKIIISRTTAEKYKLVVGDYIDLSISNANYKYLVWGIAQPSGLFANEGTNIQAAVPKEALSSIYNARNSEGIIFIKLKNPSEKKDMIEILSKEYPRHSVREPFSQEELEAEAAPLTTSFLLMTVIVFFMSAFIVHSSFKVLTVERLPVIGTFRSVGATRKITNGVLLLESFVYSIIGGFFGCIAGIGILYVLSYMSRPMWLENFVPTAQFSLGHLILTFVTAIFLGLLSSILPIIKVARIPVKDIILNSVEKKHSKKRIKLVVAIISIIIAVAIPPFINPTKTLPLLMLCMLLSIVSVVLFVPHIINFSVMFFEKIYGLTFGNEGILAVKNLRDNKSIVNNISLLAIGLSSLLMINIVSSSVGEEVGNVYNDLDFDIWISYYDSNTNFEKLLRTVDGVGDVSASYKLSNINLTNVDSSISVVDGINKNNFSDFCEVHVIGDKQKLFSKLEEGRNLLLSKSLKERFNVKEGDFLDFKFEKGIKSYKIIGFFNTLLYNGDYCIVSEKYLKSDASLNYYTNFYIKTTLDPDAVSENISKKFPKSNMYLTTMEQMEINNANSNNQLFAILNHSLY